MRCERRRRDVLDRTRKQRRCSSASSRPDDRPLVQAQARLISPSTVRGITTKFHLTTRRCAGERLWRPRGSLNSSSLLHEMTARRRLRPGLTPRQSTRCLRTTRRTSSTRGGIHLSTDTSATTQSPNRHSQTQQSSQTVLTTSRA